MKYFDKYVELVESGDIVVGELVQLQIERVKRFKKEYKFYQDRADRRISFIENECSNTKGQMGMLKLALPQKVWLECAWGFYYDAEITKRDLETGKEYKVVEERRLTNEIPIMQSRGGGKTTLGSAIGETMQIIDGEFGADVQMLAYDREQAGYLFEASRAMTSNEKSLLFHLREADQLRSTKQGMLFRPTNSMMKIKTSDYESLDGTNAHCNIFDEVHTYDIDFIKVVNDGSKKKRKNWQTWYLTTNGTKREKVFDDYYKRWVNILRGVVKNDHVSPWLYCLDNISEVHSPEAWQKAIPMLGYTTEPEDIAQEVEDSENNPADQAEMLSKTFGIPVNNYLAYFTNEECSGNSEQFDFDLFEGDENRSSRCVIGIDLSDVNDICSVSFMVPQGDSFQFFNRKYIPRQTVENAPRDKRLKYQEWERQNLLTVHELDFNDQKYIFDDLREFMHENHILPVMVGYDKWNAREIVRYFSDYYGEDKLQIVGQTVKVLSQPLKIYKELIKAGKIVFNDSVATWNHLNVMVKIDANGNVFPNKAKAQDKIDVFASQLDAFVVYYENKDDLAVYFD